MGKIRETLTLTIIAAFYLLCSLRYFPGRPAESLVSTLQELLIVAPFLVGGTLIAKGIIHRVGGENPAWPKLLRIYLTLGLTVEFFLGLRHYYSINLVG